jgi:hypothetical protein
MIFPLPYLATCIVAPANTNKLWNLIHQLQQKKYVKPLALQRYPGKVYTIGGFFLLLALFSWGATVTLNEAYIPDPDLLKAANINTILYNAYFNGFPIPYVALGLSLLISRLIGKITNLCSEEDVRLAETFQDDTLESFLQELGSNFDLLKTANFLKQIRGLDDNEKIKIIFGGKEPSEVLDSWPQNTRWTDTLDFLINPTSFKSLQKTALEGEDEESSEDNVSSNHASIEYALSSTFFKTRPKIVTQGEQHNARQSRWSWCSIV